MAGKWDAHAFSPGDIVRRQAEAERDLRGVQTARRLEAATIGRGGMRVKGGAVRIQNDAGVETLTMSSDSLMLEGELGVTGEVVATDGEVRSETSDGNYVRLVNGTMYLARGVTGEVSGTVFAGNAGDERPTLQTLPPQAPATEYAETRISLEGANDTVPQGAIFLLTGGDCLIGAGDTIHLDSAAGEVQAMIGNTTGSANMLITGADESTSERIWRVTSARAAKVDIEDLDVDPAEVLALRPRTWRDRREATEDPGTDRWHVGLVAEEVDAAGLTELVDYDADGHPVAVTYDRLAVVLLGLVRELSERLDALDGGRPDRGRGSRVRKPQRRPARARRRRVEPPPTPARQEPPLTRSRRPGRSA